MNDAANEYDLIVQDIEQDKQSALKGVMLRSPGNTPEQSAEILDLADRTGLPAGVVNRETDMVREQVQSNSYDYDQIIKNTPGLAQWVTEENNMDLVRDDFDKLGTIESIYRAIGTGLGHGVETSKLGRLGYDYKSGRRDEEIEGEIAELERRLSLTPEGDGFTANILYPAAKIFGQIGSSLKVGGEFAAAGGAAGAVGGAPGGPASSGAAALGGAGFGFLGGLAFDAYRVEAGHAYLDLSDIQDEGGNTIDEQTKQNAAMLVGMANASLEVTGLSLIAAPFKNAAKTIIKEGTKDALKTATGKQALTNFAKNYTAAIAGETTTEMAQEGINIFAETVAMEISQGDFETIMNSPEERAAAVERIAHIGSEVFRGMLLVGLPGASVNASVDIRAARRAKQMQDTFRALGENTQAMKLRELAPDKHKEFIQRVVADGPVENVYIPVEAWNTYFQELELDPRDVAGNVIGDTAAYDEAMQHNGDIQIPTEQYARNLAGTEHNTGLMGDMRFNPMEMTAREAEAYLEEMRQQTPQDEGAATSPVVEDIKGQLIQAGFDRSNAETYASFYGNVFNNLGKRSGMDPMKLFSQFSLTIQRPLPEALGKPSEALDTLDPLLDSLRAGEIPQDQDIFGQSLVSALREIGIVDDGGELQNRDVDHKLKPFERRLINEQGMGLDQAAEWAHDRNYITEADPDVLLEAIDAELAGRPVFNQMEANQELLGRREQLNVLGDFLDQMGVDLNEVDNAAIKELIGKQSNQVGGQQLFQPGNPAFDKWFGDSQVVDENGDPLPVYHGSGSEISEYEPGRASAIYFAPRKGLAESYGDKVNEVYLKVDKLADLTDTNSEAYKLAVKLFNEGGGWSEQMEAGDMEGRTDPNFDPEQDHTWEMFDNPEVDIGFGLLEAGYDGLKLNEYDGDVSFAVFNSSQVKSATGNAGTFDPNSGNIYNQEIEKTDPLDSDGDWQSGVIEFELEDGTVDSMPAGEAMNIINDKKEMAKNVLDCVNAN